MRRFQTRHAVVADNPAIRGIEVDFEVRQWRYYNNTTERHANVWQTLTDHMSNTLQDPAQWKEIFETCKICDRKRPDVEDRFVVGLCCLECWRD